MSSSVEGAWWLAQQGSGAARNMPTNERVEANFLEERRGVRRGPHLRRVGGMVVPVASTYNQSRDSTQERRATDTFASRRERTPHLPSLCQWGCASYNTCGEVYRWRAMERGPKPRTVAQVEGTLIHAGLGRCSTCQRRRARQRTEMS